MALCDVDEKQAAKKFKQYESVPKYKDFRKMLDKEDKNIDAVIVCIPDFMHGMAAMQCMERGKGVLCAKAAGPAPSGKPGRLRRPPTSTKSPHRWGIRGIRTKERGRLPR